jgi:acyl phosphate:glycerol-3-phosphate acyltransferase
VIEYALALIMGYLLGSIPFGLLSTRLAGLGDVRAIGSGNIGATNVLRTGRKDLAALTVVGDVGKGIVAVLIAAALWFPEAAMVAGVAAFFGHVFPIWLGFRGGKGVATYIGILLALSWPVGLSFCGIWLLVLTVSRYSSLSALTAAAAAPMLAFFFSGWPLALASLFLTAVLFYTHRENIARLRSGSETRVGAEKTKQV